MSADNAKKCVMTFVSRRPFIISRFYWFRKNRLRIPLAIISQPILLTETVFWQAAVSQSSAPKSGIKNIMAPNAHDVRAVTNRNVGNFMLDFTLKYAFKPHLQD
ncbi:hypothetical protein ACHRVK_03750 [Flavobacterium plurextorum]|uniref:hypothetical protein n=1 Tax=Flavobacterium plurextorum TaxID=1114867 RepID=UPI003757D853